MTELAAARAFIGDSLGFHIIFAAFGIGLPVVTGLIEWWSLQLHSEHLRRIAQLFSKIMVLLVVVGVASGSLIALQLYLFWPGVITFGRSIIGIPFQLESYAFLLEAIGLVVYSATWQKITGYRHLWLILPVILGSALSAVCITLANAWMNDPHGFDLVNGVMTNVDVWTGLFTWTAFYEIIHSLTSYYLTTFLVVVTAYAWYCWKHQPVDENKATAYLLLRRFIVLALVCECVLAVTGDASLRHLASAEPRKFAALEIVATTGDHQPYIFGGQLTDTGQVEGGIAIPNVLSIMTGGSADTVITGITDFARQDWPILIIHTLFEIKMLLVGVISLVPLLGLLILYRWKKLGTQWWVWLPLVSCGPLTFVMIELGWMLTELGRQPYAIAGYVRTTDAFAANASLMQWGAIFPITFVGLFIITIIAVRKLLWR